MCGITGYWDLELPSEDSLRDTVGRMASTLVQRGPDAAGIWVDPQIGVAVGHRRLSVIDLSSTGAQPMCSSDGRFVISYNGEIYNALELRAELERRGLRFRGHSDTEVVLEACAAWGVPSATKRFIGMFAFSLWDKADRCLYLIRDRLGIKPIYWGQFGELFLFGSELKSLRAHPGWTAEIDLVALSAYLQHGYVPAPLSIYRGVAKLQPGHVLTLRAGEAIRCNPYWELTSIARKGATSQLEMSDSEAIDHLDSLIRDSVGRRMVADVPLGVLLSGGIDSTTVAAMMQELSSSPVKSYTIGFGKDAYNEAPHARAVAKHLGTQHTELEVEPEHARQVIPSIPDLYDEPFADSSKIPTYLVSKLARQEVTVALSGDGGDELFAGYNRHRWIDRLWRLKRSVPQFLLGSGTGCIRQLSPNSWDNLFALFPRPLVPTLPGEKLHKIAEILCSSSPDEMYGRLVSYWHCPRELVPEIEPLVPVWQRLDHTELISELTARLLLYDTITYLPDDILTKVDRASMAVSLEARVPLLDHRLVEFAWKLPTHLKLRNGKGKWVLRKVLERYVPQSLVDRPKTGFGVPIDDWLRGPLRGWAEELLDAKKLREDGLLDPAPIQKRWREHLSGRHNWQHCLWAILMVQAWQQRWMSTPI